MPCIAKSAEKGDSDRPITSYRQCMSASGFPGDVDKGPLRVERPSWRVALADVRLSDRAEKRGRSAIPWKQPSAQAVDRRGDDRNVAESRYSYCADHRQQPLQIGRRHTRLICERRLVSRASEAVTSAAGTPVLGFCELVRCSRRAMRPVTSSADAPAL